MIDFLVYDKDTGEIVRAGACQPELFHEQASEQGEAVMLRSFDIRAVMEYRVDLSGDFQRW